MTVRTGNGWEMRLGDCIAGMRELADSSVDVTITDPPYEAEAHENGKRQGSNTSGCGKEERGKKYARVCDAAFDFAPITNRLRLAAAKQIARVTRHCALVFCQVEAVAAWKTAFNKTDMPYRRAIPWNKPDAMPSLHGRWPGQAFEAVVLAVKSSARDCPVGGKARYYECSRARSNERAHPTAKPLALIVDVFSDFTLPGDLVLDCFSGSGVHGAAALLLGRRFIGWELNRDYYDIACRRLRGEEAKPNPAQPSLFGGAA